MECETIIKYTGDGKPVYKPKVKFDTLDDAIDFCKYVNSRDSTIHKVISYKCSKCHKYHVGRSTKELTDKERTNNLLDLKYGKNYKTLYDNYNNKHLEKQIAISINWFNETNTIKVINEYVILANTIDEAFFMFRDIYPESNMVIKSIERKYENSNK